MAGPKELTPEDYAMFVEEAIRKISQGETIEKIARDWKWPEADVKSLCRTKDFQSGLEACDPDAHAAFIIHDEGGIHERATKFVDDRLMDYMEMLDQLARDANSEQVRLNAVLKLMSMGRLDETLENMETIQMEPRHEERLMSTMKEAFAK